MSNDFLAQTTLKILVNDWSKLREIIANITKSKRAAPSPITESDLSLALVSDDAIQDVFEGPYHALLRPLVESYALISKLRAYTVVTQDEALKPHVHAPDTGIPSQYQKTVTAAVLDKLQRELDEVAQRHFSQWQAQQKEWQGQLLMQLTAADIALSDLEIGDLSNIEPLFELKINFQQHSLTLPKGKNQGISMSDYWRAKTLYVMHSALGRQLKPHTQADLDQQLKTFKPLFQQIEKQEATLQQQIKADAEAVIRKLA